MMDEKPVYFEAYDVNGVPWRSGETITDCQYVVRYIKWVDGAPVWTDEDGERWMNREQQQM